jgi:hypothetical protein
MFDPAESQNQHSKKSKEQLVKVEGGDLVIMVVLLCDC